MFVNRYARYTSNQPTNQQTNVPNQRPTMQNERKPPPHLRLSPLFPFFPSIIPSNFLLNASLTLLCPAHSQLILFMRQAAMTMNPTARNDGLFFSVLPILPRRLSARRKRGDEGLGVTLISERRLRSIWLLRARIRLAESGRIFISKEGKGREGEVCEHTKPQTSQSASVGISFRIPIRS